MIEVKNLKPGEIFHVGKTPWIFGELRGWKYVRVYDRSEKGYACTKFYDASEARYFPGDKLVDNEKTF